MNSLGKSIKHLRKLQEKKTTNHVSHKCRFKNLQQNFSKSSPIMPKNNEI